MKKINLKILNISFWIEIILAYVLPFQIVDNSQYRVGFPLPFKTAYEAWISTRSCQYTSIP